MIMPKTYGVPVAFLGVPNDVLPAAAVEVLPAAGVLELLELLEPLELQPTAVSAMTLIAAALSDLSRFIWASFLMVVSVGQG